ncbi:MAG: BatA domain-containing protein [Gemmatimonadota bacterium]
MTFAAPWFLAAGAAAAVAVVALHFLARQEPRRRPFPTARFVPETEERAPARSVTLSDRLLLLLRLTAIALAAIGFARPSLSIARRGLARVIFQDTSRAVRDPMEVARSVAAIRQDGDPIVRAGSLSTGLIRAIEAARALRDEADSVSIVAVSPLAREEIDAATLAIRSTWPGGIVWTPVARAIDPMDLTTEVRAAAADPLRATLALAGITLRASASVRLIRDGLPTAADSAWARAGGHRLVDWPSAPSGTGDTTGAVVTANTVLVVAFDRPARPNVGTPVAWWADGEVAATEQPLGAGCARTVAVPVPSAGDLMLRERIRSLVRDLLGPCGGRRDLAAPDSATVRAFVGPVSAAVPTESLAPAEDEAGRAAVPWLLAMALGVLVVEQLLRRRSAR